MIITVMIMIINDDDEDDDNCHISVRVKLNYDLLIPSSTFSLALPNALHSNKTATI